MDYYPGERLARRTTGPANDWPDLHFAHYGKTLAMLAFCRIYDFPEIQK